MRVVKFAFPETDISLSHLTPSEGRRNEGSNKKRPRGSSEGVESNIVEETKANLLCNTLRTLSCFPAILFSSAGTVAAGMIFSTLTARTRECLRARPAVPHLYLLLLKSYTKHILVECSLRAPTRGVILATVAVPARTL